MHEVAAMHEVVITALDAMRAESGLRIISVQLVLGASGHLSEDAARLHFALQVAGTPAEGARLDFTWLPATFQCFTCLRQFESVNPAESVVCPSCAGDAIEIAHDDTISLNSITVEIGDPTVDVITQIASPERVERGEPCASAFPDV